MGRSSQQKAQENRAGIVDTACRMFRASGIGNVSVADVMAANGMTVGGFYKHFESKDALVAEVLERTFDQSLHAWERACARADEKAENRMQALVRQYLRNSAAESRCPVLAFSGEVAADGMSEECVEIYESGSKRLFDMFINEVAGKESHEVISAETEDSAMVLFAAMIGTRLLAQSMGSAPWVKAVGAAVNRAAAPDAH